MVTHRQTDRLTEMQLTDPASPRTGLGKNFTTINITTHYYGDGISSGITQFNVYTMTILSVKITGSQGYVNNDTKAPPCFH